MQFQFLRVRSERNPASGRNLQSVCNYLVNHGRRLIGRLGLIDVHADRPFAAREPDFSAGGEKTGRFFSTAHLDRFQPFGNSIEGQVHAPGAQFGDRIQVVAIDCGDPIRAADPECSALVFHELVNAVAGEPLRGRVMGQSAISPAVQAAGSSSKPQPTVRILMNGPNFLVLEGSRDGVTGESVAMQAAHTSVRADPEIAVAVFEQRTRAEVAKPVRHLKIRECAVTPTAHSLICGNPYAAVAACQEGANKVVNQPLARSCSERVARPPGGTLPGPPSPPKARPRDRGRRFGS